MITLVVGDTKPDLSFWIRRDGVDISDDPGITGVEFRMEKPGGTIVTKVLSKVTLPSGEKRWEGTFATGDLDQADDTLGEVVVFWGASNPQHSPDPFRVLIRGEYREARI